MITQSGMAFVTLVAAFSLVVTQFQSVSTLAAAVARLSALITAVERSESPGPSGIEIVENKGGLACYGLTLLSSSGGAPLIKDLSISIPRGARVLVAGPNRAVGDALLKAMAGAAVDGVGRILLPPRDAIWFIAERRYLPPGSLRQILSVPRVGPAQEDRIVKLLHELELESILTLRADWVKSATGERCFPSAISRGWL